MDLLILGGTSWLGGAVASLGVRAGHRVTCLARGRSGPVPAGAGLVARDRWDPGAYDGLPAFDAAIEVSWQPLLVSAALKSVRAEHWVYVSSGSVYADNSVVGAGIETPLLPEWTGDGEAEVASYGEAKVACERAYATRLDKSTYLVARAGLIAGYGDRSDRFGYWPARVARADVRPEVLVPAPPTRPVQVIDVGDLAAWLLRSAESQTSGVYDAVGAVATMQDVLAASAAVAGTYPTLVWADDDQLVERRVEPWAGRDSLPLWVPDPDFAGFQSRRNHPAVDAGLSVRPLSETVAAALRWETEQGLDRERRAGLGPEREAELLASLR
jgi:2'-hydroxyisoflavone reductase